MASTSRRWWLVLGLAALVMAGSAGLLIELQRRQSAKRTSGPASPACPPLPSGLARALPGAEEPPVILWGVGAVRLFVDGEPAFSAPDAPKHLRVGEHSLKVEAPGAEPLITRFRIEPFTPALLHAELDTGAGITLVRLGAACASCELPATGVDLEPERSEKRAKALLADAALALRRDRWLYAAKALRKVPVKERRRPLYLRLAARVYVDSLQPELARQALDAIPAAQAHDLRGLLGALDRMGQSEHERRKKVALERWNKLTERLGGLVARFGKDAPGPAATTSRRFERLSKMVEEAVQRPSGYKQQEEAIAAAEQALLALAGEIRATRPEDCAFQAEVAAALVR